MKMIMKKIIIIIMEKSIKIKVINMVIIILMNIIKQIENKI